VIDRLRGVAERPPALALRREGGPDLGQVNRVVKETRAIIHPEVPPGPARGCW
jgi:hypothetical protein